MKNANIMESIRPVAIKAKQFFVTHQRFIFFIAAIAVLIGAMFNLNLILNKSSDDAYRQSQQNSALSTKFDMSTITKLKTLQTNQQSNQQLVLPNKRVSPFSE